MDLLYQEQEPEQWLINLAQNMEFGKQPRLLMTAAPLAKTQKKPQKNKTATVAVGLLV